MVKPKVVGGIVNYDGLECGSECFIVSFWWFIVVYRGLSWCIVMDRGLQWCFLVDRGLWWSIVVHSVYWLKLCPIFFFRAGGALSDVLGRGSCGFLGKKSRMGQLFLKCHSLLGKLSFAGKLRFKWPSPSLLFGQAIISGGGFS